MRLSLLHPIKILLYYTALLLLMMVPACQCKKDNNVTPPPRPEPPKDIYLVTAIRVNNVPKDSLVYNDQQQVTERWDYNSSYRIWQNYIAYTYNQEGYVSMAKYYNENDNTVKSLSQKDSVAWNADRFIIYTTFYRELGNEISGYDTLNYLQTNNQKLLTLVGTKDTISIVVGVAVLYKQYQYNGKDITQFLDMNWYHVYNGEPDLLTNTFDLAYLPLENPLFPQVSKNPLLFRTIGGDKFPYPSDEYYPYLLSEHLTAAFTYKTDNVPSKICPITYKMYDTTHYPQTQSIAGINKTISYTYKVIKAD